MTEIPSNQISTSNSPLTEADETSLNELMERDPLELTKQDISIIVHALRRQRKAWEQEEATAKKTGKRPNAKAAKEAAKKITLDNLELDL